MLQSTEYRHYKSAVLFSLVLSFLVAIFLVIYGKEHSFHAINRSNHALLDNFFQYWTYLGHGMIWVPLVVYSLFYKRDFLIALALAGLICALFTQGGKRFIYPDELRPVLAIGREKIRIVEGITPHTNNSFPSGHTSTAFTLALLAAYIVRGKFWMYFFPLVAFFVGYSRVYLAHHFVSDVFAGMLIGIVSSYIALLAYQKFRTHKARKRLEERALKKQTG